MAKDVALVRVFQEGLHGSRRGEGFPTQPYKCFLSL